MSEPSPPQSALHPARMGLEPLALADWLKPQPGDDVLRAERARIIATYSADVMAALPESDAAVAELAALTHRRGFAVDGGRDSLMTLAALGNAIAEDLCILTVDDSGGYLLTAGILCFPNRWRLAEKIGGNVLAVHSPVPDYAGQLADGVDRFLARLKPERAYLRRNWGLSDSADLYLPDSTPPVDPTRDRPLYLRAEDQTFLKLPETGAVVFAIRTTVTPWDETPENHRREILDTIPSLSDAWLTYKAIRPGR